MMFRVLAIGILLFIQYYFFRMSGGSLASPRRQTTTQRAILALFLVMNIPLLLFVFWIPKLLTASPALTWCCIYPFYIWHFSFLLSGLVLLIIGIVKSPYTFVAWIAGAIRRRSEPVFIDKSSAAPISPEHRRKFLRQGMTLLAAASFGGTAYGAFKKDDYESTTVTIPIVGLPPEFEGFSIALVSDIHSSVFMSKEMMTRYADAVNALSADLIAVTGDFVNSQVEEVYPFAEAFSRLRAPHGVYGVLGNHDYYSRNVVEVARRVEECGIKLLTNANTRIEKRQSSIYLLGSDDIGRVARAEAAFDTALSGTTASVPKVLMCHRPYYFETAEERGIDLVLSGHTHGGQIVFAKINDEYISPARMASKYVSGLYTMNNSHMYVSRGIGTVGVPVRINCPPEITKIILARA